MRGRGEGHSRAEGRRGAGGGTKPGLRREEGGVVAGLKDTKTDMSSSESIQPLLQSTPKLHSAYCSTKLLPVDQTNLAWYRG